MSKLYRIIDANLNRSREGLRVIEDIIRFTLDDAKLSIALKNLRHKLTNSIKDIDILVGNRNAKNDVGKPFSMSLEGKRRNLKEVVIANFRRVEESLRVLEEIFKIYKPNRSKIFKSLRFKTYTLEKKVYERL